MGLATMKKPPTGVLTTTMDLWRQVRNLSAGRLIPLEESAVEQRCRLNLWTVRGRLLHRRKSADLWRSREQHCGAGVAGVLHPVGDRS